MAAQQPKIRVFLAAAATIAGVTVLTAFWFLHERVIATQIGERRTFTFNDGSEVTLNTATRINLDYNEKRRYLRLQQGEALFKVAKDPNRPFVVAIGDRTVVALGTSFLARRDTGTIAVTLIEGKVSVSTPELGFATKSLPPAPLQPLEKVAAKLTGEEGRGGATILSPDQRLTLVRDEQPRLGRPALEMVTVWRYGRVNLDHASVDRRLQRLHVAGISTCVRSRDVMAASTTPSFHRSYSTA